MMYNYNAPIFCSPLPLVPVPVSSVNQEVLQSALTCKNEPQLGQLSGGSQFQRPASQATSVKAEPGSAVGSIASASVANKVSV